MALLEVYELLVLHPLCATEKRDFFTLSELFSVSLYINNRNNFI